MLKVKICFFILGLLLCHACMPLQRQIFMLRRARATFGSLSVQIHEIRAQARALTDELRPDAPITFGQRDRARIIDNRYEAVGSRYVKLRTRVYHVMHRVWFLPDTEEYRLREEITHAEHSLAVELVEIQQVIHSLLFATGAGQG